MLLLFFFVDGACPAFAFDLNALWQNNLAGGEETDFLSTFKQVYRAGDGIDLSLTDAISAGATVSYNRTQSTGKGISELVSPGATLQLGNDIFNVGFSGQATQNRRTDAAPLDSSNWQTYFAPASYPWNKKFWPGISFYYGESQVNSPERIDSHESTYGGSVNWGWPDAVKLFYGYDNRRSEDLRSQRVTENGNHLGRLDTGGKFWDDRIIVKMSQGITFRTVKDSGIIPASGFLEQVPEVTFVFYSLVDENDPGFIAHTFPLAGKENSSLGNLENSQPIPIAPGQSWHLGISPVFAPDGQQQADRLRIYVEDPFELDRDLAALQWDLYASFDGVNWEPVQQNLTANVNSADQRFEVDIPALDQEYQALMVVVTNQTIAGAGAVTANIRAVEAIPLSEGQPGSSFSSSSENTSYTTNVAMRMKLSQTLSASSNLDLLYGADYYDSAVRGNLRWTPSPLVSPSLAYSETRRDSVNSEESIFRTYSLSVPVNVLPTLNVNLGVSQTDRFKGSEKDSTRSTYLFGAAATLYPDLTAALTETYSTGNRKTSDGGSTEVENFSNSLTLKARLNSKLTCELGNSYEKTILPRTNTTSYSDLNFYFRPSDLLSMDLRLEKNWLGDTEDTQQFVVRMALLSTRKTRLSFNSQFKKTGGDTAQKSFGLQGSWDISKIFTLKSQGVYSLADTYSWTVLTSLYMRL